MKALRLLCAWFLLPLLVRGQQDPCTQRSFLCADSVSRPYLIYRPAGIADGEERPLLVYLHGAISRVGLKEDPRGYLEKSPWVKLADEGKFLLLFAYGEKGCGWFDSVGVDMVLGEVAAVPETFPVDPDRIFLSGFSDGGSGALYFAMTQATPFAGFIALNGHFKVSAKIGEAQVYAENMNEKPLYAVNTRGDLLYPSADLTPIIDHLRAANPDFTFRDLEGNHDMSYLPAEAKRLLNFIATQHRKPAREISLETAGPRAAQFDWLEIQDLDTTGEAAVWHEPQTLYAQDRRATFGLKYDYAHPGPGLKVNGFRSDTALAVRMGVQVGDLILMMEQDTLKGPYDPYFYLGKKEAGAATAITLERNGEKQILTGVFDPPRHYEVLQHRRRSGKVRARIQGKELIVKTSRVAQISIDPRHFPEKLKRGLKVIVNGRTWGTIDPQSEVPHTIQIN